MGEKESLEALLAKVIEVREHTADVIKKASNANSSPEKIAALVESFTNICSFEVTVVNKIAMHAKIGKSFPRS